MRALLLPVDDGPPLELTKEMTLIGRSEGCDMRLDHKSVSKLHCALAMTDGLILLRDLGSTNGTRVNGQRVRRAALLPNDQLGIANLKFRVVFGSKLESEVLPEEKTQQIDARDLEEILKKAHDVTGNDEAGEPIEKVKTNVLPDVYPDDEKKED